MHDQPAILRQLVQCHREQFRVASSAADCGGGGDGDGGDGDGDGDESGGRGGGCEASPGSPRTCSQPVPRLTHLCNRYGRTFLTDAAAQGSVEVWREPTPVLTKAPSSPLVPLLPRALSPPSLHAPAAT